MSSEIEKFYIDLTNSKIQTLLIDNKFSLLFSLKGALQSFEKASVNIFHSEDSKEENNIKIKYNNGEEYLIDKYNINKI